MTADAISATARTRPSRRTIIGALAGLLGTVFAGGMTLATVPGPAAAIDGDPAAFEVGDGPTVTSNDGHVEAVYLAPEITVSWTDFSGGLDNIQITLAVGSSAGVDPLYVETLDATSPTATPGDVDAVTASDESANDPEFDAVDGGLTIAFDRVDATSRGDAVTSATLSDPELTDGETETTTLDVVLRADITGSNGTEETVVRTTSTDVVVTNPDGEASLGGSVVVDTE